MVGSIFVKEKQNLNTPMTLVIESNLTYSCVVQPYLISSIGENKDAEGN